MSTYLIHRMFVFDNNFDPKEVLGHRDLISCFSDFALYFDKQLVYFILLSDYE